MLGTCGSKSAFVEPWRTAKARMESCKAGVGKGCWKNHRLLPQEWTKIQELNPEHMCWSDFSKLVSPSQAILRGRFFALRCLKNGNPRRRSHGGMEEGPFGGWCSRRPAMSETVGQPSTINGLTMVYCIHLYTVYCILWYTMANYIISSFFRMCL